MEPASAVCHGASTVDEGLHETAPKRPGALDRMIRDIIVTTTPSDRPILTAGQVAAGQHITAMGSDAEHKNEIDPALLAGDILYFCDRLSQTRVLGELHHAIEKGLVSAEAEFTELGQVIAQQKPGRDNASEITLCDLTGTGIQDTAIATLAFQRCQQQQAGTAFAT